MLKTIERIRVNLFGYRPEAYQQEQQPDTLKKDWAKAFSSQNRGSVVMFPKGYEVVGFSKDEVGNYIRNI